MFLPPSPRWLTLHGHQEEADAVWNMLGVSHAEREKVELQVAVEEVPAENDQTDNKETHQLFEIFQKDVRGRTALAVFLMGVQQLSGIDGVLYVG
jgi:hypothetical protein